MAKEVDNDKQATVAIEKFCESFEKEILEEFDKAYEEGDPRVMAVSYQVQKKNDSNTNLFIHVALCQGTI